MAAAVWHSELDERINVDACDYARRLLPALQVHWGWEGGRVGGRGGGGGGVAYRTSELNPRRSGVWLLGPRLYPLSCPRPVCVGQGAVQWETGY